MRVPGLSRGLGLINLGRHSIEGFFDDDMPNHAAALAFRALFALFPFAVFLVALLGFLNIPGFFDWALEQSQVALPDQASGRVEEVISQVREQGQGGVLSFGIVVGLWVASSGVRSLMTALNAAYDVEESRSVWLRFPLSVLFTLAFAATVILAIALMLIGPRTVEWLADQVGLAAVFVALWGMLRWPVAVVLLMVAVSAVYRLIPNVKDQSLVSVVPGAILAVIGWVGASAGFSYYVGNFANYGVMYGSLGAVIVLLTYFFISAAVLLLGAEVNSEIRHHRAGNPHSAPPAAGSGIL